jgi:hypothetical protein
MTAYDRRNGHRRRAEPPAAIEIAQNDGELMAV